MKGVATPSELNMLRKIFDDHCNRKGVNKPDERENIAGLLMSSFVKGIRSPADLERQLNRRGQSRS